MQNVVAIVPSHHLPFPGPHHLVLHPVVGVLLLVDDEDDLSPPSPPEISATSWGSIHHSSMPAFSKISYPGELCLDLQLPIFSPPVCAGAVAKLHVYRNHPLSEEEELAPPSQDDVEGEEVDPVCATGLAEGS